MKNGNILLPIIIGLIFFFSFNLVKLRMDSQPATTNYQTYNHTCHKSKVRTMNSYERSKIQNQVIELLNFYNVDLEKREQLIDDIVSLIALNHTCKCSMSRTRRGKVEEDVE